MLNNNTNSKEGYEYLWQAAQQAVNSGADPAEVEAFVADLAPLYERFPRKFEKQPVLLGIGAPDQADAAGNGRPQLELPPATQFSDWQEVLIAAALLVLPAVSIAVGISRVIAAANGVTIGLGPQISFGAGISASLGAGLCVLSNGRTGCYGSISGMAGVVASISLTAQITIINGGLDKFSGWAWGVGIAGGEEIVGNAAALLSTNDPPQFLGITAGIGIGAGIPIEAYLISQRTWTR